MLIDTYEILKSNKEHVYEFFSDGPKGKIKKIIKFTLIQSESDEIYNLGFGDEIMHSDEIDDLIRTDNKDTQKILATVAKAVTLFLDKNASSWVFASGSTESRTRLYQIGINSFKYEIDKNFDVYGLQLDSWEVFKKGKSYDAFLIKKK